MGDYIISCCSTADLTRGALSVTGIFIIFAFIMNWMENSIRMTLESQAVSGVLCGNGKWSNDKDVTDQCRRV